MLFAAADTMAVKKASLNTEHLKEWAIKNLINNGEYENGSTTVTLNTFSEVTKWFGHNPDTKTIDVTVQYLGEEGDPVAIGLKEAEIKEIKKEGDIVTVYLGKDDSDEQLYKVKAVLEYPVLPFGNYDEE